MTRPRSIESAGFVQIRVREGNCEAYLPKKQDFWLTVKPLPPAPKPPKTGD